MSTFYSVKISRVLGTCVCEATGCTSSRVDGRTRTFLLTKEEYDQIPENPDSHEVMKTLFHGKKGKPVCHACRSRLRQSHMIMEAFTKPKAVSDDQPTEVPTGTQ